MANQPKLVNKQFNSPINLYSDHNVREVIQRESQMLSNGAVGVNFYNPAAGKPTNLQNSAVLRMLEEEENRQRNGQFGTKKVAWPPQENEEDYAAVQSQGGTQNSSSPGLQNNLTSGRQSVSPAPQTRSPLKPLDISSATSTLSYQHSPRSPVLNQSPVGFRPQTPTRQWAPVPSPVQAHPPYATLTQHQPSSMNYKQQTHMQTAQQQSHTTYQQTQQYQRQFKTNQQTQQYQPSYEQHYENSHQYESSQNYQTPQQSQPIQQQPQPPQQQYQPPQQQYQPPQQQYQPPQQQYQPPQQQYQPPQQQYQPPQQQYQPPQQQYQPPQQQYQPPQQQYQPPQQQYQPPQQQYQPQPTQCQPQPQHQPQQSQPPQQQYQSSLQYQPNQAPKQQSAPAQQQNQYQQPPKQQSAPAQQQNQYQQPPKQQFQAPQQNAQPQQSNQQANASPGVASNQVPNQFKSHSTVKNVEPPPSTITLRPQAPVSQAPSAVYSAQPATATLRGGKHLRGDLKWPPENVKMQMEEENRMLIELSRGPAFKPRKALKDYTGFFAQHALNSSYPGYNIPPGTQFYRPV